MKIEKRKKKLLSWCSAQHGLPVAGMFGISATILYDIADRNDTAAWLAEKRK